MATYKEQQNQKYIDRTLQMLCDLPDFCSVFYDRKQRKLSPKTLYDYTQRMKAYLEYLQQYDARFSDYDMIDFTVKDLSQISISDAADFIGWITHSVVSDNGTFSADDKMSFSSAKTWKACISAYFMFFTFNGQLNSNPFNYVDLTKIVTYDDVEKKETEKKLDEKRADVRSTTNTFVMDSGDVAVNSSCGLSKKKSAQFRQQFILKHGIRDTLICSILQDTGIRISELVELNEKDVDLGRRHLYIYRERNKSSWFSFSDDICDLLKTYMEQRANWIRPMICESDDGHSRNGNGGVAFSGENNFSNTIQHGSDGVDFPENDIDNMHEHSNTHNDTIDNNVKSSAVYPSEPSEKGNAGDESGDDRDGKKTNRLDLGKGQAQLFTKQILDADIDIDINVDFDALFIVMTGKYRGQRLSVRTVQRIMKKWKSEMGGYQDQKNDSNVKKTPKRKG